ncbi:MAG: helix-turn-helix domain-containing protein, partial [Coriobacteriales bacterium]|nr:helix-turn-helix domain-containing protein [Coriobacteriales bacterium]
MITQKAVYHKISESAKLLEVSVDTIRRWEKMGLIKAFRNENNHRVFSIDELKRVLQKTNGTHSENRYKVLVSDKR